MKQNNQKDIHLIYLHKNKINNKIYIGQTIYIDNPSIRWGINGIGYKKQLDFYEEIKQYGWDNFEHIILESNLNAIEADEKEKYYISLYDTTNPEKGYNRSPGGSSVSLQTRQKMSENWHEKSPERAKKASEQMKQFNSTRIYPTGEKHPRYGDHSKTGEKALRKRAVQCLETGEIFATLTLASQWCNPNGSNLRSHIAQQIQGTRIYCGRHPETGEKLHWRYVNETKESEKINDQI